MLHHPHVVIIFQFVFIADQEIPIQIIKRAGFITVLFGDAIAAIFAIIRHFVDI